MTDRRILIVAHRTAASPKLLAAVAERAARGPCMFTLLIPRPYFDPDTEEAAITLELAIPLLDAAAGSHVQGIVGATDPYEAVRQTLEREKYDEVIVSTLPERVSRWLRLDLAHRIERFGVPVSVVTAKQAERTIAPVGRAATSDRSQLFRPFGPRSQMSAYGPNAPIDEPGLSGGFRGEANRSVLSGV